MIAPYGSWRSPITAEMIAAGSVRLDQPQIQDGVVYWTELRPAEGGRVVVMRRTREGRIQELTPPAFSVRTRVHEYGGAAYLVAGSELVFANFSDQRLYRLQSGGSPRAITPEGAYRYADAVLDRARQRLIAVCEDHASAGQEPINSLVAIPLSPQDDQPSRPLTLARGADFYAAPRLSPDGSRLAWLTWDHPNLPWNGAELWVAEFNWDGGLVRPRRVAGGSSESIFQPEWSPDGQLYFVSDRSGWWNLYRWNGRDAQALCPMEAEFGAPQWVLGMSTYGFESADRILCAFFRDGAWRLAQLEVESGRLTLLETPYTSVSGLRVERGRAVFVGASPDQLAGLVELDLETGAHQVIRRSSDARLDQRYFSAPQRLEFPTTWPPEGGTPTTAWAYFYPPTNPEFEGPPGERPPLLVMSHGGPTSSTTTALRLAVQFWTSRGFAVLDVDYGGSSGYGRAYRERLRGSWGLVDVLDCLNGARYLVQRGLVDGQRLAISGGSAGGYTTLCALTFHDLFQAGASYYGVSDLAALARDTHKFESRYLDQLVGPYPEREDLYRARSPIHFADRLSRPVIFFQGLDDPIVPPSQTERMVEALRAKGVPVAYLAFEGEQHGFRKAETIRRSLEAELYFYSRIFGFRPADPVEPVRIENL